MPLAVLSPVQMLTHLISHSSPVSSVQMMQVESRQCVSRALLLPTTSKWGALWPGQWQGYRDKENCAGGRCGEEGALMGFSGELAVKMEERETLRMEPSF